MLHICIRYAYETKIHVGSSSLAGTGIEKSGPNCEELDQEELFCRFRGDQAKQWHNTNMVLLLNISIVTLLVAFTSATELTSEGRERNIKLVSFTTNSQESIKAIFQTGSYFLNVTSYVQDESALASSKTNHDRERNIVSCISLIDSEDGIQRTEEPLVLSQLVIPKKYLSQRKIPDMEERIVCAAKDMVKASQKFTASRVLLSLPDLVNIYGMMIEQLVPALNLPRKFNQGRAAIIYHDSIARTALRLAQGAPPERACPAHQAYDFQGLFACQQEYNYQAKKVLSSKLFHCRDIECIKNIQRYIALLLLRDAGGLDIDEVSGLVEDVLGLNAGNNSKLAEDIARLIACGNISCFEPGCNSWIYTDGWFIDGIDWGCCGDYPGCCFLATEVCLVHDAICTCCSFPTFCLDPFCKPDPWCSNITTTNGSLFP